ncbi:sugar transferase [Pseudofulvibacter geojedonensis]|uniref:Sugar transferase n=1 Tax=Pseudofulvibacter geojedonensis TaxID=1123758 RepID=A0ABW3HYG4_9FLAO
MQKKGTFHFELSERKLLLRFLDVILSLLGLHLIGSVFEFDYFTLQEGKWIWSILLVSYLLFFGTVFELYDLTKSSDFFKSFKAIVLAVSVTVLCYILTPFLTPELPESRVQIIYFFISIVISICLGRLAYINLINAPIFRKNVILIADGNRLKEIEKEIKEADTNYNIQYVINSDESNTKFHSKAISSDKLLTVLDKGIHEIIVTRSSKFSSKKLYNDLLQAFNNGYLVKEYAEVYEDLTNRVQVSFKDNEFYKQFPFSKYNNKPLYIWVHRFFDIVFGLIGGLFLVLTIIPLVFLGNLFANKGPMFYTQERVGKNGKTFNIYKLRSMVVNAEREGAVWAQKNDSRVTRFGKFLRKTRLDEFPQFINIIKGEMSVIGPRPERPVFVGELAKEIPFYSTRHIIKPGLTGWAQVNTSYGATVEDSLLKLQYDLFYIKHRNIFLDFKIVLKTLSTVIFFRGQ